MGPDITPETRRLLEELQTGIRSVLGDRLVGLYLYGSLVTGDFAAGISDADLLAATRGNLTERDLEQLRVMHADLVRRFPDWDDRIEVAYLSAHGLRTFRTERSPLAIISPGEPLHRVWAGTDWLMNWYAVRAGGVALYGQPPDSLIPPISLDEFIAAIRQHADDWGRVIETRRSIKEQSYAILTLCRALYSHRFGKPVSKERAAAWAMAAMPEWSELIERAWLWRSDPQPADLPEITYPETARFVRDVRARIATPETFSPAG
jgi:predicted nucleotidyltransferase